MKMQQQQQMELECRQLVGRDYKDVQLVQLFLAFSIWLYDFDTRPEKYLQKKFKISLNFC